MTSQKKEDCLLVEDLSPYIDTKTIEVLNESTDNVWSNALIIDKKETSQESYLESDVDEQILINLSFKHTISFLAFKIDCDDIDYAPKTIKIFHNFGTLGFDNCEELTPTVEFIMYPKDLSKDIKLDTPKLKFVNNLTIFIEDNQGDMDTTKINKIHLLGRSGSNTDMSKLRKC
jgi:hypothetical protein